MKRTTLRLLGWGLSSLVVTLGPLCDAKAQPATAPAAKPGDEPPKAAAKPTTKPAATKKPGAKPDAKSDAAKPKDDGPHDAAEVEAQAPAQQPASSSESMPDPTPGPDPFRNDATPQGWSSAPISTSGSQLLPSGASANSSVAAGAGESAREAEQSARIHALEQRVAAAEDNARRDRDLWGWLAKFKITGYVQPQFVWSWFNEASSPNVGTDGLLPGGIGANDVIAKSDGTTTNQAAFRMKRARVKLEFAPSEYAKAVFEIDPNLSGGPAGGTGTIARNIEAIGHVPWTHDISTDFGMGIFKLPFSHEIVESDADRPFIDRSFGEQSMFPSEFDTGVHAYTHADYERFLGQIAIVNGTTIGEKNFAVVPDLNKGKDVVGRVNYDFGLFDLGLGGYYGQGQSVDATTLRFKQFPRWAGNLEGALHHTFVKKLGGTRLYADLTLAKNMDRGTRSAFTVPSIPLNVKDDVEGKDERSWQVRLEQDLTRWVTLGGRFDTYSPDTAQASNERQTLAFVAAVHFTKGLQAMLEFDHAVDHIHRPNGGISDKRIETLSSVLQARF